MKNFIWILVSCLMLQVSVSAAEKTTEKAKPYEATRVMVAMEDGTRLATDVYLPEHQTLEGASKKFPVVLMRSPYSKRGGANIAKLYCAQGYALVVQDMRGRFDSEGSDAIVFFNDGRGEHHDGHDTIAWLEKQKWCNQNIVTFGGSALGVTQVMLAPGASKSLKAQYIQVAFSNMYEQSAYQGGVWRKSLLDNWLPKHGFDPRSYEEFAAHPRNGEFWNLGNAELGAKEVNAPAIFWGGWYDIFAQGTINSFVTIHNGGDKGARGKCRLVMGPWAHGTFDQLTYPENSKTAGEVQNPVRFFDHHAKGIKNGVSEEKAVHYYVMGDTTDKNAPGNFWRSADNWPPPATKTAFYLHDSGHLKKTAPVGEHSRTYAYDPTNPIPTEGGQNLFLAKGPRDQRKVEERSDVLVFSTEVLKKPIEVTGRIKAKLYVSSDCPDTDFTVKLTDVYPDGRSMLVTDGILRARFRDSFELEQWMVPGQVYELEVDLGNTSLIFNKGHQLRIAVSSSNDPRFEPNANTGAPHFKKGDPSKVAKNTIYLSKEHPSHVVLPVYAGE